MYDIIIIGAGPGGYHCAIRASQKNLKVALIEKDKVGGVCLNRGCIPTKALYSSAKNILKLKKLKNEGINVENFNFDFSKIQKRKDDIVENTVNSVKKLIELNKIDLFTGEAKFISKNVIKVNDEEIKAKNIIIATGSSPLNIDFFKIDHKVILDSTDILNINKLPKSMIILGAGVMGIEFATIFNALGVDVQLIELENQILPNINKRISKAMEKILKSRNIKIDLKTKISNISVNNNEAIFESEKGKIFKGEKALISIGRKFNSDIKGLKELGLVLNKNKSIEVDDFQKTNIKNIYAIGDVAGKELLAHKASYEAEIALADILNYEYKKSVLPSAIFSIPEIASVGEDNKSFKKGIFSYSANAKAVCLGESEGLIMVYSDENNYIKGATILGEDASNLVQIITLAINNKNKIEDLIQNIFPHPTLSEIVLEASEDIEGFAIHKFTPKK